MSRADEIRDSDALWHQQAHEHGWMLPPPAPAVLRLPIMRWLRFVIRSIQVHRAAAQWAELGIGIGGPNQYDRWVLWAVYRGWC